MPTRRMIDPSLWKSESLAQLTIPQRYLFIGLFSNADDQGRLQAHPALIRSHVFPFDDSPLDSIQAGLKAIEATGSIKIYCVDGKEYLQLTGWWSYQSPQWAYPSKIPAPEGWHDRLRYRKENKVVTENWTDCIPNDLGNELPKDIPNDNGNDLGGSIELGLRLSQDSIDSSCADAQGGNIPQGVTAKKPSDLEVALAVLENDFSVMTGIPLPERETEKQKKSGGELWWQPLGALWKLCDNDVGATIELMHAAHGRMTMGDKKLTVSSPKSIKSVALSIYGDRRNGNGTTQSRSRNYTEADRAAAAAINAARKAGTGA